MTLRVMLFSSLLALGCLGLAGCVPSAQSQSDEEKESHFLAGKSRVSTMDYKGAVEAFEKALEINPRSASAHFELACLYDQHEADPSAAIYHYEKYLKLRPAAGNSDVVKERISTCKQELARNVLLGPLSERQQRDLEQLARENKALADQVKRQSEELEQWRAYGARVQTLRDRPSDSVPKSPQGVAPHAEPGLPHTPDSGAIQVAAKTHTVKPGETLTAVAKKYGVRLDTLKGANPGIDPRRMRVGQVLQIPGA